MYTVMGPILRYRTPRNVVDEIQFLYERYGQNHISFMDDNININKSHILDICSEIIKRNLNIQFETPSGLCVMALDQEVVEAMVHAGWVRGAIAIESGNDFIRNKVMGKHLSRTKIFDVIKLLKSYRQLYIKAFFLIGMPEDTPDTLMDTYNMLRDIDIDEPYVTNLMPFPGTAVFEQARRDNLFVSDFDLDGLWAKTGFHYHTNSRFYIRPYKMSLESLYGYREKFDELVKTLRIEKGRSNADCFGGAAKSSDS